MPIRYHHGTATRLAAVLWVCALAVSAGCGTTRWSDTARTATEQLLISSAIDKAISEFDFSILAGKEVFFDSSFLRGVTDENYIVSTLRQHLLANGCILRESKDQAEYVVEARSGGVGTDRSDLLFGVPAVSVPAVPGVPLPSAIPELPFAKSTNQKAVAKIAVFAYNRITGRPVMQTGVAPATSTAKNSWFFGAGPFQHGTVYEGTNLAGSQFDIPIIGGRKDEGARLTKVPLTGPAVFPNNLTDGSQLARQQENSPTAPAARMVRTPETPAPNKGSAPPPPVSSPAAPAGGAAGSSASPAGVQPAQYLGSQSGVSSGLPTAAAPSTPVPQGQQRLDLSGFGELLRPDRKSAAEPVKR
jgi:hypothetical protein